MSKAYICNRCGKIAGGAMMSVRDGRERPALRVERSIEVCRGEPSASLGR